MPITARRALRRMLVVPLGRMEDAPREAVQTGDIGSGRFAERPESTDEHACRPCSLGGRHQPPRLRVVPARVHYLVAEADPVADTELVGAVVEVGLDLRLQWVEPGPVRIRREGKRVQRRRNIALSTGVGVHVPRSTDRVVTFEDEEVLAPLLLESNRGAEPAEPGPDDRDVDHRHHGIACGGGGTRNCCSHGNRLLLQIEDDDFAVGRPT